MKNHSGTFDWNGFLIIGSVKFNCYFLKYNFGNLIDCRLGIVREIYNNKEYTRFYAR